MACGDGAAMRATNTRLIALSGAAIALSAVDEIMVALMVGESDTNYRNPLFLAEKPKKAEKRFARIAYSASPRGQTYRNPLVSGLEIRRHIPRRV